MFLLLLLLILLLTSTNTTTTTTTTSTGKLVRKFDDIIYERKIFCEVASIMNNEVSKIISGGSGGSGGVENMNIMLIDQLKFNHQCTTTSTVSEVDTHEFYGSGYDGSLGWTTSEQKFEM